MTWHTAALFGLPQDMHLLLFVFFGTLASYNFHWALTPKIDTLTGKAGWAHRNRYFHWALCAASLLVACWYGFRLAYWPWLLFTAALTFLYSAPKIPLRPFRALKGLAVAKTIFLTLGWTHVTVFLPLAPSWRTWELQHYFYGMHRFFLIYAICILFDYRDREADRREGIRSLVTGLPDAGIHRLYNGVLLVTVATGIACLQGGWEVFSILALMVPAGILLTQFRVAQRQHADLYYYFFLDGLMALSGIIFLAYYSFI